MTMPKHVGVKELKNTLSVECAFVGANKALMYQKLIMNIVNYTAILLLFVGMKCDFAF
jgi:hypothetical protein